MTRVQILFRDDDWYGFCVPKYIAEVINEVQDALTELAEEAQANSEGFELAKAQIKFGNAVRDAVKHWETD